jgi:four helix bundle protein
MAKAFRDLLVWQRAMDLTQLVYGLTEAFPRSELYGLTSQMRRSAVSIPSNIAEGAGRSTKRDFAHFIVIARGSNYELETQILIAERLGYINQQLCETAAKQSADTGRLLKGLLAHLKSDLSTPTRN